MNVLMTGMTGYLGGAVARQLLGNPTIRLCALKRSFSDTTHIGDLLPRVKCFDIDRISMDTVFKSNKVDVVLHCATNYGRNHETRSDIVEANLVIPLRLLDLSVQYGVKAFINTDTMLDKGISDYTLSKKQFNDWLRVCGNELLSVNMALEHFFGPRDDPSKFVSFVIRELLRGADRIPLTLGEQRRDFVYIDDVVSAFEHVMRYVDEKGAGEKGYSAFEVGRGESIAVKDFLLMIRDISGNVRTRLEFGALPYRPNEIMSVTADVSQMKALGWVSKVGLAEALRRTIEEDRKWV